MILFTTKKAPFNRADDIYYLELFKGFLCLNSETKVVFVARTKPDSVSEQYFKKINVKGEYVKISFVFWFFKNIRLINREKVFYTNEPGIARIFLIFKKIKLTNAKLVFDWHVFYYPVRKTKHLLSADLSITTSLKLKNHLMKHGGADQKIKVVYGGVDIDAYRSLESISPIPFSFGYVGLFKTLGMEKGIKTCIDALRYLPDNFTCICVGARSGEFEEYLTYARSRDVETRLKIVERVPQDEVAFWQKKINFLVIPYPDKPHFRDFGFPMKVYEYMATGHPIIYSQLELVEEVISDCAYPFVPDDSKSLANVIMNIVTNSSHQSRLTDIMLKKIEGFTWKKKAETILGYIQSLS